MEIAAARQPLPTRLRVVPLALFALMVPISLLRGYSPAAFRNPVYGVIAVEEADRMPSELAVTAPTPTFQGSSKPPQT